MELRKTVKLIGVQHFLGCFLFPLEGTEVRNGMRVSPNCKGSPRGRETSKMANTEGH